MEQEDTLIRQLLLMRLRSISASVKSLEASLDSLLPTSGQSSDLYCAVVATSGLVSLMTVALRALQYDVNALPSTVASTNLLTYRQLCLKSTQLFETHHQYPLRKDNPNSR